MTDLFPVNSGNVPPPSSATPTFQPIPSQSTLPHVSNAASATSGPGLRRRKRKDPLRPIQNLKLERILGLTTASSNILATADSQDLVAYAAGAVVVLYNHKRNKQVGFLYPPSSSSSNLANSGNNTSNAATAAAINAATAASGVAASSSLMSSVGVGGVNTISAMGSGHQPDLSSVQAAVSEKKKVPASTRAKPISCLAFSPDGNYLAAGEVGHQPRILIWDVKERILLHECRGHKFGVLSLAFSPNMRYLVSIGLQHDGYLYVWHWRKGIKLAGNKVTSKVNALSFSKDGTYFVTAGLRHVKYWYFDARGRVPKRGNLSSRETQVLDGRSGILGALRESNFVAVGCDRGGTNNNAYFLTDSGILCMFKEGRVIDKWVDLQAQSAYSIAVSPNYVVCACANGVIRLFEPGTLKYCGMLPKPHPLGTDISSITSPEMLKYTEDTENAPYYPDAIAVAYDDMSNKVTAVYSDRSLFLWDIHDLKKIGKYRSFIYHSECVWGIEPCPTISDNNSNTSSSIPPNSFATYSADGTVRFWNLDHIAAPTAHPHSSSSSTFMISSPRSNVSSPISPNPPSAASIPISPSSSTSTITSPQLRRNIYSRELIKMLYIDTDAAEFSKFRRDVDFTEDQFPDFGIRSLKMSQDGKLLVTGDRNGNLRVHDMDTWEQITYQEAHDSEILSMDVTNPTTYQGAPYMIATASRDRLLHVFDINNGYQLTQTLDDHSSSITAVKFTRDAKKLISCGADKGVIFRSIEADEKLYATYHNYAGRGTVFDMSLDVNERYIATVTGERRLYVFSIDSGKPVRICKPETAEEAITGTSAEYSGGSLINIDLDPFSGTFAVTSGSDRCLRLFDLTNSACIEKVCAHAELITAVKFIRTYNNSVRVVSTCSDGTVFVWKIAEEIVAKMKSRWIDREHKAQQMVVNAKSQEDMLDDRRAALIRGAAAKPRFRRVSTTTAVQPTPSISQMARGERKTFSSMSPAERKYDDLYKKMATRRNNPLSASRDHSVDNGTNNNSPTSPSSGPKQTNTSASPATPASACKTFGKSGASGRKTPEGKLERLYTGVPTTGARERTYSHIGSNYSPVSRYGSNSGNAVGGSSGLNQTRQGGPVAALRMNPVLRRQMSREALGKMQQPASPGTPKETHRRPRSDGVLRKKRSSGTPLNARRASGSDQSSTKDDASQPNQSPSGSMSPPTLPSSPVAMTTPTPNVPHGVDDEDDSDLDFPGGVGQHAERATVNHAESMDDDGQEAGDEREVNEDDDDDDDDEDEEEQEEEVIFIAPEQDEIGTAFEVTSHEESSTLAEPTEDGPKSASASDEEKQQASHPHANDDEEGSSEENTDDAIIQAITSREAPRMTPSLSRTTSVNTPSSRKSMAMDENDQDRLRAEMSSPVPAASAAVDGTMSPNGRDTPAFRELQRKLEKARKRQSLTARYLLSLGGSDRRTAQRTTIDNVLNHFQQQMEYHHQQQQHNDLPPPTLHIASPPLSPTAASHGQANGLVTHQDSSMEKNDSQESMEKEGNSSSSCTMEKQASQESSSLTDKSDSQQNDETPKIGDSCLATSSSATNHDHVLADLDGAIILLDTVLESYTLARNTNSNDDFLSTVQTKLENVAQRISKTLHPPSSSPTSSSNDNTTNDTHQQQQDPETLALLDKYSNLLIQMVEKRLAS
ncbi:mitogen-activated protein kinase-binding protein1 isoform 1 [Lichtheimia corymbifera JMRC:FSU:9682]|uniref:Mitogen-activated protein kinase-binding protein1 isoform 1 n=1 Tax=Lichtheimia corymbifera JMRC:FSU:9682 TaxID=1263082 RepID=A0A068RMI2_9FUNG|nr:mitogen-activated protein kinase-binding protein1 isoform 1 [Lichtheimia corymbifera JMRC:FSU:9682]